MTEIDEYLDGWCPSADEYHLYELWKERSILPYAGGWLDQPLYVHRLLNNCALYDEWLEANHKLPSTAGLPSFSDVTGG